jgi:hypothetical protein
MRGVRIPSWTSNPRVTRTIRFVATLTSTTPSVAVRYVDLAAVDVQSYGSTSERYQRIRVQQVRCWLESPVPTFAVPTAGLVLLETASLYEIRDRPVLGVDYASCGMQFSLPVRQAIVSTTSTATLVGISTDDVFPTGTNLIVTADFVCEFT